MARYFFSFDFEGDAGRAEQIRRSGGLAEREMAGFFSREELDEAAKQGSGGMHQLIQRHLRSTSVTVVLIGAKTANDHWVRYGIDQSIEQMSGLLGIYIGHMMDESRQTPTQGLKPIVPAGVEFPAYSWDGDPDRLIREIVAAGNRSDGYRARRWAPRKPIMSAVAPGPAFLPGGFRRGR